MTNKNVTAKIESLEPMILLSASAIEGTDGGDWLSCTNAGHTVYAGGGDDTIHAPTTGNIIDGGDGVDQLVIYEGNKDDFKIDFDADGRTILEGKGINGSIVKNVIMNVEKILFNDGHLDLSSLKSTAGDYSNKTTVEPDVQWDKEVEVADTKVELNVSKGHSFANHSLLGKLFSLKSTGAKLLHSKLSLLGSLKDGKSLNYGDHDDNDYAQKSHDNGYGLKSIGSSLIGKKLSLLSPLKKVITTGKAVDSYGDHDDNDYGKKSYDHGFGLKSIGKSLIGKKLSLLSPLKKVITTGKAVDSYGDHDDNDYAHKSYNHGFGLKSIGKSLIGKKLSLLSPFKKLTTTDKVVDYHDDKKDNDYAHKSYNHGFGLKSIGKSLIGKKLSLLNPFKKLTTTGKAVDYHDDKKDSNYAAKSHDNGYGEKSIGKSLIGKKLSLFSSKKSHTGWSFGGFGKSLFGKKW